MPFLCGCSLLLFASHSAEAIEPWNAEFAKVTQPRDNKSSLRIAWHGVTLQQAVATLESRCKTTIFVDRRVDPTQPIDLQAEGDAQQLVQALANATQLGSIRFAGVHYLGPAESARDLPTLHARVIPRVAALPSSQRTPFLRRHRRDWNRLSLPRDIIQEIITGAELEVSNPDLVPHDLWHTKELPAARFSEQLTLLLVGFQLDWRPTETGKQIELMPIDSPIVITHLHKPKKSSALTAEQFLSLAPEAKVRVLRGVWAVRGRVEHHALLEKIFREGLPQQATSEPATTSNPELANQRFTLTVKQQPAGAVLRQIAAAVGIDASAVDKADFAPERISFSVQQATLQELLDAIGDELSVSLKVVSGRIAVGG